MLNLSIDDMRLFALHVGFCQHDGDWNWKNVRSPFARIYYVTEGSAQVVMPDGVKTLRQGYLYFIPAYTMHSDVCTSIFSHYYIHVYEDPNSRFSIFEELSLPFEVEAQSVDVELMQRMIAMNPQMRVPQSDPESYGDHQSLLSNLQLNVTRPLGEKMESRGTLYILMSRFMQYAQQKNNIQDDRIRKSLSFIRKHLGDDIDVATMADMAFMSKDHFIRVFRQQTGFTPIAYIIRKKMECAELQLITTDVSIKQISSRLGYDDQSYFIKLFKTHTNLPPQQYREAHR